MQVDNCIMCSVHPETDKIFKALADPTRRYLLDRLHEHNGQTLGELCERIGMTRQSATQHLSVLEAANLISTVRRGRENVITSTRFPSTRSRNGGSTSSSVRVFGR